MGIKESLYEAFKEAMKSGDEVQKTTLRLALAAIKNAEIDTADPLEESHLIAILQKEVKSRREAMEDARKAGRADLITAAEAEIEVLEAFLPRALSEPELEAMVREAITETGAKSMREMGDVMKRLMPRVQGRADGKTVSDMVRKFLSG